MDKGFVSGTYISGAQRQIYAVCGTINNNILYFCCTEFALKEAFESIINNPVQSVLKYFFTKIQNLSPGIKGIVLDIRNNDEGNIADLNFLLGKFTNVPLKFGSTRYKSSNGRFDYTSWIDATITPYSMQSISNIPIFVLADNYSISLAEIMTMAIKTIPNTTFVGETTWGATGPLTDNSTYNDGQFQVGSFLSVFTSSAEFRYVDNLIYESKGFPPDIQVSFKLSSLQNGVDPAFEKAISLIK